MLTGIAFVDSSITGQGSRGKLPANATILPMGTAVTGTTGCPTTQYGTDGLIVAVIDYQGRKTSASLTIARQGEDQFARRPPYYIDLDPGRTLQFLGPVKENGTYELTLEYDYAQGKAKQTKGQFTLNRTCR